MTRKVMRALMALMVLPALIAQAQIAATYRYSWAPVSATGALQYLNLNADLANGTGGHQTVDVTLGTGTNSACTWQLEGSNDLVNWYSLSGVQSCTAPTMVSVVDRPTTYVRVNVLSYTGTASLTFNWTGI